jgi:general L-amino acid transport system substrate-binding protein
MEDPNAKGQFIDKSKDARIRRLLGLENDRLNASNPGLLHDSCRRIIRVLGNYREIYIRNLGSTGIRDLLEKGDPKADPDKRGANKLWREGGVLSAPPFR